MDNKYIECLSDRKIKSKLIFFLEKKLVGSDKLFDIVGVNNESLKIQYNAIKSTRDISTCEEEMARISLLNDMISNLGYNQSNIELEKTYNLGRTKKEKDKRLDINLKYENSESSFAIIEVKQFDEFNYQNDKDIEGQLFNIAAIQQTKQQNENGSEEVKFLIYCSSKFEELNGKVVSDTPQYIVIDYKKFKNYSAWKNSNFEHTTTLPIFYGNTTEGIKCGDKLLSMDEKEISKLKKQIHDKLYAGGGVSDNVIFTTIVNIFLSKLHDEDVRKNGEEYQCQFKFNEDIEVFKEKINNLYREALVDKLGIDINSNNAEKYQVTEFTKIKIEQIIFLVQSLQKYDLTKTISNANYDVLGDFFESISRDQFKQNKGQFFTHQKIVDFIIDMCNLDTLTAELIDKQSRIPVVADLSAGSGTFLISAMKNISKKLQELKSDSSNLNKKNKDLINDKWALTTKPNQWAKDFIYGTEKDIDLGTAIKVNMILHGDGQAHIGVGAINGDGLIQLKDFKSHLNITEPVETSSLMYPKETLAKFDVIVSNPPFSVNLDEQTKKQISNTFILNEKEDSENLFLERYYQTLNPKGRIGVVLPESVFDGDNNKEVRTFLLKYFKIKGVISLTEEAFKPFATVKTSILFLEKRLNPIQDLNEITTSIEELTKQQIALNSSNSSTVDKLNFIKKMEEILEIKNEKTFFYEIKNAGYKRRKNKPELTFANSDLVSLVQDFKNGNLTLWEGNLVNSAKYKLNLVSFENLLKERTYRLDYNYHSVFSFNPENELFKLSDFITIDDSEKLNKDEATELFSDLTDGKISEISYCEIGDIDNSGFIASVNLIQNGYDEDEMKQIIEKIKKGDIRSVKNTDILMSSVRPYLNKNILIDNDNVDFYFTKAFLPIVIIDKQYRRLAIYQFIKAHLSKKVNAVARCGKSYPTLKAEDLLNITISDVDFAELTNLNSDTKKIEKKYKTIKKYEQFIRKIKATLI